MLAAHMRPLDVIGSLWAPIVKSQILMFERSILIVSG